MNYEEVRVVVSDKEKQVTYGIVEVLNKALRNGLDTVAIMDDVHDFYDKELEIMEKEIG